MQKVLILKNFDNSFEKFYSQNMVKENVTVLPLFDNKSNLPIFLKKIIKRLRFLKNIYSILFGEWKKNILSYDEVIVFDNGLDEYILKWIFNKRKSKIKVWVWNSTNFNLLRFRKFAEIYSFDKQNCIDYKWNYLCQFYFDGHFINDKHGKGLFFIGYDKDRNYPIEYLQEYLDNNMLPYEFYIYNPSFNKHVINNIYYINEFMDYDDIISKIIDCECVIELTKKKQTGITVRCLEALFFEKKLITDNLDVLSFDFYNKNNIFVLGVDDLVNLKNFLSKPLVKISNDIKYKYTYDAWLTNILDK